MSPDSGYQGERIGMWLGEHIDRDVMVRSTHDNCICNEDLMRGHQSKDTRESFERQELKDLPRNFGAI